MLKELRGNLRARYTPNTPTPWYSNPLVAWILSFLGPILAIGALLLLATCLFILRLLAEGFQAGLGARRSSLCSFLGIQQNAGKVMSVGSEYLGNIYLSDMLLLGYLT